jgi:monovalent cation:proton antiporter-2 (CPA2) family protein
MEHYQPLLHAIYYLLAATIAVPLFRRLGLGAILGYLVAGAIIGPELLALIYDAETPLQFSELGVVMLLFVIGLELNPEQLWKMRSDIILVGGTQLVLTATIISGLLAITFDLSLYQSIIIALAVALSSTAFAMPLMEEHKLMGTSLGRKGFSVLLLQDLAVIPILLLLASWAPSETAEIRLVPWWVGFLTVIALVLFGARIFNPLLKMVATYGSREILTAASLLIVLSVSLLMASVGFSMSMGAFLAGILLAQSSFRHQLAADIEPFKGLLLGLFFIAVGMTLNLSLLLSQPLLIVSLALFLIAIKITVIALIFRVRGVYFDRGTLIGIMLSQGGEFAFVVMAAATSSTFLSEVIANYTVLVVGVSMALTGPLVMLYKFFIKHRDAREELRHDHVKTKSSLRKLKRMDNQKVEVVIAGYGRFGQLIGQILTAGNIPFNALDNDHEHIELLASHDIQSYYGDATRMELLEASGIRETSILVIALVNIQDSLAIASMVRENFPKVMIIARAHNLQHAQQLMELGVKNPIREIYESSLSAAMRTLIELGYTEGQSQHAINIFREHDQKMMKKPAIVSSDPEALAELTKQSSKALQEVFNKDSSL